MLVCKKVTSGGLELQDRASGRQWSVPGARTQGPSQNPKGCGGFASGTREFLRQQGAWKETLES